MKFSALFAVVIALLSACDKSDEGRLCCFPGNDTDFEFSVTSPDGADLLNPSTPGYIDTDDIAVYESMDGESVYLYDGRLDYPNSVRLREAEAGGRAKLSLINTSLFDSERVGQTRYVIDWKTAKPDTIDVALTRLGDSRLLSLDEVQLNGEMVWSSRSPEPNDFAHERTFDIVVQP